MVLRLPYVPALPVSSERLRLRAFGPGDLEPLLAYHSLPDVVRYVPFAARNRDSMATALGSKMAGTSLGAAGDHLDVAVELLDGTVVGDLVVFLGEPIHQSVEVGWMFDPAHGRKGYATEAVTCLFDLVFGGLGARRAVARVDTRNERSRALCERLGMRLEAHLVENEWFKGEWASEVDYALLASEWRMPEHRPLPDGVRP